ncbi:ATP-binding cassette domain-containing protein [Lacticaseibacillus kribbianus]|uniref:ATP-binding cassette domain-containing protein n=1 Tax=Lacticaseibacillus kribbianus TaxID=2926292 RepID=UPI001CD531FC|nr:ABC transporter ATP-binding protein [Lacticaseibacillus kribbianus]
MFKHLLTRKGEFSRVIVLQAVNNAFLVCWSFLFQLIVDTAMGKTQWRFVPLTLFIMGYVLVMDIVFTADHYQTNLLKFRTTASLREAVVAQTARLSPAAFGELGVGGIIAKLTKQLDKVEADYYGSLLGLSRLVFQFLFAVAGTLVINPLVTLVALGLSLPSLALPYLTKKAIANASAKQVEEIERYTTRITDLLSGFTTLKFALAPAALIGQHRLANRKMLAAQRDNERINQITSGLAIFLNDVTTLMIWVVGAVLVQRGEMGMGQLVAFANLTGFMAWPLTELTQTIPTIIGGGKAAAVIGEFLDRPTQADDAPALISGTTDDPEQKVAVPIGAVSGTAVPSASAAPAPAVMAGAPAASTLGAGAATGGGPLAAPATAAGTPAAPRVTVRARGLGLTIGDHRVLQGVDLALDQGKKYLLVGASGSGKSTLVRLMLGELAPTEGELTLMGEAPARLPRAAVYSRIGLLAQKGYVFAATVRENMTLFAEGYADTAILAALTRAGLGPWLADHGLDTRVSEAGAELSGGEKQRLALARLFLRGYPFYVFDELTTGLDPHIADRLQRDICAMPQGFLMITHTYNRDAFAAVDEILVMRAGRLAARGRVETPAVQAALRELAMI